MPLLSIPNIRIAGIAASVPENIERNSEVKLSIDGYENEAFISETGVVEKRSSSSLTTSDLCLSAAEKLIESLGWEKSEITALFFVSQTADYIFPATSCILQSKLGLSKDCYAIDIALGCSGWVYGLSSLASLMGTGSIKKALLLAGDANATRRSTLENTNPSRLLFGDAGTATALEYREGCGALNFHHGTDGSGYEAIIIPDGAARYPFSEKSDQAENVEGLDIPRTQIRMKGMDVFAFGITVPSKSIKTLAKEFNFNIQDTDYVVLHQANLKMNETIRKKLKLSESQTPCSLKNFGNTSSASIPLTIVTQLHDKLPQQKAQMVCCGFGVGLSWGSVNWEADHIVIPQLIEI